MKPNQSHPTHRLHIPTRRELRDIALAASAVVAAGMFTIAAGDTILADGDPVRTVAAQPTPDETCRPLWDQVEVSGRPDATVEAAAAEAGLVTRGPWISFDGLSWEHVDGRVVVVAHPRSASADTICDDSAVTDGSSRP